MHMPRREKRNAIDGLQILFQPAEYQRVFAAPHRFFHKLGAREKIGIQKGQKEPKVFRVAPMRSGREEKEKTRIFGEDLAQTVALGFPGFLAVAVGREFVGFVHNHQIPLHVGEGGKDVVLLGKVHGGENLGKFPPGIAAVGAIQKAAVHDLKSLAEFLFEFPDPLVAEMARNHDEDTLHHLPVFELFEEKAGHDRFPRAGIVGQKKPEPRFGKHVEIDGVDLMGKGIDEGDVEGMERIKLVGEFYAVGLKAEEHRFRGPGEIRVPFGKDFQGGQMIGGKPAFAEIAARVFSHGFHAPKAGPFLSEKDADRLGPKFSPHPHPRLKGAHRLRMITRGI
jgi:hypothetical protein